MVSKRSVMRILRGLSSKCLPCGCLAGVYETYDGDIVGILDAKGSACREASHVNGKLVPVSSVGQMAQSASFGHRSPTD